MKNLFKAIIPCAALSLLLTACSGGADSASVESDLEVYSETTVSETEQTAPETTTETATESTTAEKVKISLDDFVGNLKVIASGNVGKNETVTDVVCESGTLIIYVDLENAVVPDGFTIKDIALSRVSSITDAILAIPNCDDFWDEIIIDFGKVGAVKNTKENIVDSEYGRYFDNFRLVKKVAVKGRDSEESSQ